MSERNDAASAGTPKLFDTKSVCIVTPDVIGPMKNGGIGTHCFHLAKTLVASGHKVSVVFTGPIESENESYWKIFFAKKDIEFFHINEMTTDGLVAHVDWFVKRSKVVFEFLKDKRFDIIHFQEWQANGLCSIQAKRSLNFFQTTSLIVTMHSSSEWINEGMRKWAEWAVPDAKLAWCERYCCEFADILISPSQHMFEYTENRNWTLAKDRRLLRYCFEDTPKVEYYVPEAGIFAFFGRLETRKGLDIFLAALGRLKEDARSKIRKIIFLGKNGEVYGTGADGISEIARSCGSLSLPYEIHSNLSAFEALDLIKQERALALVPSLLDNYPFTIIEAQMHGIPTIAAATGGIPEMLPQECLFKANERDFAAKLTDVLLGALPSYSGFYNQKSAVEGWIALHNEPIIEGHYAEASKRVQIDRPLVSICIPFYNYGQYLEATVQSLQEQTYDNFEVIIVNDGSTDAFSLAKFEEIAATLKDERFKLISKENGGVGAARNMAAQHAKGDFLIFCDADNCSKQEMIQDFLVAIHMTGGDVVSSYFQAFAQDVEWPTFNTRIEYFYLPVGAAVEIGMIENVFGDANSIFRRSTFDAVGGFQEERHTSWEDWDLHARCCLAGFRLDVCPKSLFWYRHTDAGFSRNTSLYQNQLRVLRAYSDYGPGFMRPLVKNLLLPYHFGFIREHNRVIELSNARVASSSFKTSDTGNRVSFRQWIVDGLKMIGVC